MLPEDRVNIISSFAVCMSFIQCVVVVIFLMYL